MAPYPAPDPVLLLLTPCQGSGATVRPAAGISGQAQVLAGPDSSLVFPGKLLGGPRNRTIFKHLFPQKNAAKHISEARPLQSTWGPVVSLPQRGSVPTLRPRMKRVRQPRMKRVRCTQREPQKPTTL